MGNENREATDNKYDPNLSYTTHGERRIANYFRHPDPKRHLRGTPNSCERLKIEAKVLAFDATVGAERTNVMLLGPQSPILFKPQISALKGTLSAINEKNTKTHGAETLANGYLKK